MPPPGSPLARRSALPARAVAAILGGGVVVLSLAAAGGACSLDWGVRADPGDALAENAAVEAGAVEAGAADAPDATADAPLEDGGSCDVLAAEVVRTKAKARECQLGQTGQCTTTVQDECDCAVVVRFAGSPASTDYANAVGALVASCGRPASCGACPQLGLPGSWACLQPTGTVQCTP